MGASRRTHACGSFPPLSYAHVHADLLTLALALALAFVHAHLHEHAFEFALEIAIIRRALDHAPDFAFPSDIALPRLPCGPVNADSPGLLEFTRLTGARRRSRADRKNICSGQVTARRNPAMVERTYVVANTAINRRRERGHQPIDAPVESSDA